MHRLPPTAALLSIGLLASGCAAKQARTATPSGPSAVVARMAEDLRRCYEVGRAHDARMRGGVRIAAKIDAKGHVASITLERAMGLSLEVLECLADRVLAAVFTPPEGGSAVLVIPLRFDHEGGEVPWIGRVEARY
jgi:hypothetical protein